jgi:glycosyltransferase involved in cell wall biosynthesis
VSGPGGATPKSITMLLSRGFFPDPRVHKEAAALSQCGHRVTVLAWDRQCRLPQHEALDGFAVERLRLRAALGKGLAQLHRWLWFWYRLAALLLARECDVIHAHDLDTLPVGWLAAKLRRRKLIFDAHEPNYYAYWPRWQYPMVIAARMLETLLARGADHVIVTNPFQHDRYSRMGVRNVTIVANYPTASMVVASSPPPLDPSGEIVLGRVGAVYEDTGIEETVDAVRLLQADGYNIKLLLAGRVIDSYQERLAHLLQPLAGKVEVTGAFSHDQIASIYRRFHISVQPYRPTAWFRDITPTKFFESMAHGVPVIVTDIGGIGEIVREVGCGLVLPAVTPEAISEAVKHLVKAPQALHTMAERGMAAVRQTYNWEQMVLRLRDVYESL